MHSDYADDRMKVKARDETGIEFAQDRRESATVDRAVHLTENTKRAIIIEMERWSVFRREIVVEGLG
jgi:hypothetical protein